MRIGEGNDPDSDSGAIGANPPAYGEPNAGQVIEATWEILPAARFATIRLMAAAWQGQEEVGGDHRTAKEVDNRTTSEGRIPASTG
ncbi:MAG TPA: hypothetical protein VN444_03760 [Verrucomicrobiae bacterium]|nr:hypothetical protein [Verrucomicrobiae bacterium]